jgi:hypothetical protein
VDTIIVGYWTLGYATISFLNSIPLANRTKDPSKSPTNKKPIGPPGVLDLILIVQDSCDRGYYYCRILDSSGLPRYGWPLRTIRSFFVASETVP